MVEVFGGCGFLGFRAERNCGFAGGGFWGFGRHEVLRFDGGGFWDLVLAGYAPQLTCVVQCKAINAPADP